jgi:hypothetical protein
MSMSTWFGLALAAMTAGTALADTADRRGERGEAAFGIFGEARTGGSVLVVRDYLPWGGDVVPVFTDAGVTVTAIASSELSTHDLSPYCLVYLSGGTTQAGETLANNLQAAMPQVEGYVQGGGHLLFFTGTWGASYTAPGGLQTTPFEHLVNQIDTSHPIGTGIPDPFEGSSASHDLLLDLPEGSTVITSDPAGTPTGVEYDLGFGHCIVMAQPVECYLPTGGCGNDVYPHMEQLFHNAVDYATTRADCGGGTVEAREAPRSFQLLGNWPNPFNPTTTIAFSVAETAPVRLSVYNLSGDRVAVLHEGLAAAGRHEIGFDAGSLPSGLYFSRLEAGSQVSTQRMLLVK